MNAPTQQFDQSQDRSAADASSNTGSNTGTDTGATGMRWAALHEAGKVVAMLAGLEPEQTTEEIHNFPALIRDAAKWRRDLADARCTELAAVMEPGISALLAVNSRGADCKPAALALWREYVSARTALLALLPASGDMEPKRSA